MTEEKRKEFFTKFTKVVGDTTKHYEFKGVDPLEVFGWIEAYAEKRVKEAIREVNSLMKELPQMIKDPEGNNHELYIGKNDPKNGNDDYFFLHYDSEVMLSGYYNLKELLEDAVNQLRIKGYLS